MLQNIAKQSLIFLFYRQTTEKEADYSSKYSFFNWMLLQKTLVLNEYCYYMIVYDVWFCWKSHWHSQSFA